MNRLVALLAVLSIAWTGTATAELILSRNGESAAPIVVFEDAPPFTRQAADELAEYIEKSTGVRPEILEGMPEPVPDRAIWVGVQPGLDALFPNVDLRFQHPEEILIAANRDHLLIAGRDRWDPDHMTVQTRRMPVVGIQQEYGTVNAVYTFLRDHLGVRWLWPGEWGEDVPETDTLAFEPFTYRYHPPIRFRAGVFRLSQALRTSGHGFSHDWSRRQRLQLDSLEYAGHAFTDWWERFHETHPEYFALQPDGTRSGWPNPRNVKICQSNRAVADQWLALVEEQLEHNPTRRVFSAATNDGQYSGHCICEDCRAWDHPEGELRRFIWQGLSQHYVALSDRETRFANRVARLLRERYPDEDYYVMIQAYGFTRPPPIGVKPDDNVIIASVANFLGRGDFADHISPSGQTHREQFQGWGEAAKHMYWRPNTGSPAGGFQGQPDIYLHETMEDMRWVAELGTLGLLIDIYWEHWATQGPLYYLMAHLAWDPYQDGRAMLTDYYERGFGPAAEPVAAYWTLLDEARRTYFNAGATGEPDWRGRPGTLEYHEVYDEAFFDKAYSLLDRAAEAAAEAAEKYRKRIDFLRLGLDHTRLVLENRILMARLNESGGTDTEAREQATANWEKIREIAQHPEHPHAINWSALRSRGGGLHPGD